MPKPDASELIRRSEACRLAVRRYDWKEVFEAYTQAYGALMVRA